MQWVSKPCTQTKIKVRPGQNCQEITNLSRGLLHTSGRFDSPRASVQKYEIHHHNLNKYMCNDFCRQPEAVFDMVEKKLTVQTPKNEFVKCGLNLVQ